MKILRQVQSYLAVYGIGSHQQPFNARNWLAIFVFGIGVVLNSVHLFYEVKTFQEYTESIFSTISSIAAISNFIYIVSKMRHLYECFDDAEKTINDSEFRRFPPIKVRIQFLKWKIRFQE